MTGTPPIVWRRSTRSGTSGGNCVEVAALPAGVAVRDSKHPGAGHLTVTAAQWRAFLHATTQDRLTP